MSRSRTIKNYQQNVSKYLLKCGSNKWKLELSSKNKFNMAVVVPAVMEYENIRRLLETLSRNNPAYFSECFVIFVINNLESSEEDVKNDNHKSLGLIREIIAVEGNSDKLVDEVIKSGLNIGLVDAATGEHQFDEKSGGVGLARKIGMDLALTKMEYNNSSHKNILVCLDADCVVDDNYITEVYNSFQQNDFSGAYIKFRHKIYGDETVHHAITCYELYMRYYVLGLKIAGSPYAFHTVGSTIACDVENYIKIGGMSKKKGGEDFYFMEKLAKIGSIGYIDTTTVYPAGRHSWRVPFGTGPRVQRFGNNSHDEYLLYPLKIFLVLKKWLDVFNSDEIRNAEEYLNHAGQINKSLYDFLIQNSFEEEWGRIIKNSRSTLQIRLQKLLWFDGFRTLKLIHYLRDNDFPEENMFDVLDDTFEYLNIDLSLQRERGKVPIHDEQKLYLEKLRQLA